MSIDKKKVEFFLKELKKRGKEMSGGIGRSSYELRDPDFYWEFGEFLVKESQKIDEEERYRWVVRQTKGIEKEILGAVANEDWLVPRIYRWADELQDKKHFMYVADIAGHKVGTFRIKVMEYIYDIYSKKDPSTYSESQKKKLADKLQKKLTHTEINGILKDFRGKTTLGYGIRNQFDILTNQVEEIIENGDQDARESFKNEIGVKMIDKLRTFLQILPLDDQSLFEEMCSEYKSQFNKKLSTKYEPAEKLSDAFGKCIKDKDLKKKITKMINSYEMGSTNTFLGALESQKDYEYWKRTKENFEQMDLN